LAKIAEASSGWEEFGSPSLICAGQFLLRGSLRGNMRGLAPQALVPQKAPQGEMSQ